MNNKFDLSEIDYSANDIKKKVKIPKVMTEDLAEFIGILVGDGHVGKDENKSGENAFVHYEFGVCGNSRDERYCREYVDNLLFKLFNLRFHIRIVKERHAIVLRKYSKAVYLFLSKIVGIPQRKDNVEVPDCILRGNEEIKAAFLRGLADTDFCLTFKYKPGAYPVINGASISERLIRQSSEILFQLGIKNSVQKESQYYEKRDKTYTSYKVYINGHSRVQEFMNKIGFSNNIKLEKYAKFEDANKKRGRRDLNP